MNKLNWREKLYNFLDPASGLVNRYYRSQSINYFQRRNYFKTNSIFIDNIYDKIAIDVAMSRFKHIKITKNDNIPDMMDFLEFSPLQNVLAFEPNDYETPLNFWTRVIRKMLKHDIAVVVPTYKNGEIYSLHLASTISEITKHHVIIVVNDVERRVNISSVWIFENPKTNLSMQLNHLTNIINDNLNSISERINEKATLKGFLKLPTKAEDKILKKKAEDRVSNIMSVARGTEIGYLQQGEEFQELNRDFGTATSEELEFLKQQLYNNFGLNEDLFTCDYSENQYRAYFSSILKPYQRVIYEEINRKYFTKTSRTQGHKLLMYYDMFDITSLKDLNEFAFKMKYSSILNANEIRAIFGYGAYLGGEVYETNKNAVKVGETITEQITDIGGENDGTNFGL